MGKWPLEHRPPPGMGCPMRPLMLRVPEPEVAPCSETLISMQSREGEVPVLVWAG